MRHGTRLVLIIAVVTLAACGKSESHKPTSAASSAQPISAATAESPGTLAAAQPAVTPSTGASATTSPATTASTVPRTTSARTASKPKRKPQIPDGQLPHTVAPLAYTLAFTMDPAKPSYSGHEQIKIHIKKALDTIWLHGKGIQVKKAQLALADGKKLDIRYKQMNHDGVVMLSLPHKVRAQKATLDFDFTNKYSPGLMGAYTDTVAGKHYVFTQFEAIAARRAFPSFDEPRFKTPFTLSFTVPAGDKVVANTPVKHKSKNKDGSVTWRFVTTHPLPTYLIDWNIGPFDIVKGPPIPAGKLRDHSVPVYGVTVAGKGDQIRYAVDHAKDIIEAEEHYYGIAYPWHKLSLIAVPDFAAGAMENPGAVTFRDSLLLMNPKTAPTRQKRAYWSVAAHELGHMWTGDLVTVPWWNDIWLNEAFATWMSQKVIEKLHPDWHEKIHMVGSAQRVMHADSLASAREIRQPIKSTGDIKTAFDGITYSKGAAVIRMFEHSIGPRKFRQGMHDYLAKHAYGSGTLEGLLDALSSAAGKNIAPAFKTFLNQPGLPMVHVGVEEKDGQPIVHLSQSRYFPVGSTGNIHKGLWDIPMCLRYDIAGQKPQQQCTLLDSRTANVTLDTHGKLAWIMPNAEGIGYYQWALDGDGYGALMKAFDTFTPETQLTIAGSIDAAFHDASLDTAQAMKLLAPLTRADNHAVAEAPMMLVSFAREHLVNKKQQSAVEAWARKLYRHYDVAGAFKPGGAPKDANQRQFESSVAAFLADTGRDKTVRTAAAAAADRVLDLDSKGRGGDGSFDIQALSADFVPTALKVALQDQGKPVFNALVKTFKQADNPFVRNVSLDALASATQSALAKRVRNMALDKTLTKRNEVATILFGQFGQPETRDATWSWLKTHYSELVKRMPGNFGGYLPRIAGVFCNTSKANEVKTFFQGKLADHPGSQRTLAQAMERASLCAALKKAQSPSAKKFFTSTANGKQ